MQAHDAVAALVRRHDPDRFLTALFAPPDRRDALLTLYALNHELARAREVVSEPPLALIRLQWWREVAEGASRPHEVASPLSAALEAGLLHSADLLALIDAREAEAEPAIETLEAWRAYVLAGAGGLAVAAGRLLGAPEPEALRACGAAYGVSGILRSVTALAAQGRCLLPADVLARHGLSPEAAIAAPASAGVRDTCLVLMKEGGQLITASHCAAIPRQAIAAALPAVLARRDLARWPAVTSPRGLGDRLAVVWAAILGRV